eukprot:5965232-Prymnesium_polylepis.1
METPRIPTACKSVAVAPRANRDSRAARAFTARPVDGWAVHGVFLGAVRILRPLQDRQRARHGLHRSLLYVVLPDARDRALRQLADRHVLLLLRRRLAGLGRRVEVPP